MKIAKELILEVIDEVERKILWRLHHKLFACSHWFREKINPSKKPVYGLGSPDPIGFTGRYNSFSGVDIKVFINEPCKPFRTEDEIDGQPGVTYHGCVGTVQGISFGAWIGSMTFVVFDNLDEVKSLVGKTRRLVVVGNNEYGDLSTFIDEIVKFEPYYSWGISIDDVVTEAKISFTILEDKKDETD